MKALLAVVFLINGEWHQLDGWHPIEVNAEDCAARVEMLEEQLQAMSPYPWRVSCE